MQYDKIHAYIESLIPERQEFFIQMENYAAEHCVPIMEAPGMEAMLQILRILEPKRILEIGTAIGYSALRMAYALPEAKIVTIERDSERCDIARQYFEQYDRGQIMLIEGDALETEAEVRDYGPFDAIFIDAAKGQYKRFFTLYSRYLSERGIIITDNVLFKGLVAEEIIEHKRTKGLVQKIKQYNKWLMSHPDYKSVILPVGDGVAISKKGCRE